MLKTSSFLKEQEKIVQKTGWKEFLTLAACTLIGAIVGLVKKPDNVASKLYNVGLSSLMGLITGWLGSFFISSTKEEEQLAKQLFENKDI